MDRSLVSYCIGMLSSGLLIRPFPFYVTWVYRSVVLMLPAPAIPGYSACPRRPQASELQM